MKMQNYIYSYYILKIAYFLYVKHVGFKQTEIQTAYPQLILHTYISAHLNHIDQQKKNQEKVQKTQTSVHSDLLKAEQLVSLFVTHVSLA